MGPQQSHEQVQDEQQFDDAINVETNTGESIVRGETSFTNLIMEGATTNGKLILSTIDNLMKTVDVSEIPATQYDSGECRHVDKP